MRMREKIKHMMFYDQIVAIYFELHLYDNKSVVVLTGLIVIVTGVSVIDGSASCVD